jgi:hypothetical protein
MSKFYESDKVEEVDNNKIEVWRGMAIVLD